MRIVSLVPSWTETFIEAGLNVVGRTRFCVHPEECVRGIPVVGGTKEIDWDKVRLLKPDLIIMDREENPRRFSEESPFPWIDTHVTDLTAAAAELRRLGKALGSSVLGSYADRLERLMSGPKPPPGRVLSTFLETWGAWSQEDPIVYVIWKGPWMAVGEGTYIGSVLNFVGLRLAELPEGSYPQVSEDLLRTHVSLFSSEPFPFVKRPELAKGVASRGALVDGESFSWFGLRGLRFLESLMREDSQA
ncbi:MAG: Fe3+-siderophores ABC transporter protein [Bdellovibrionaceae bacterium]|nr:Fe3+-siderophores ABC transporter protein [Pseudobdellovibrionaceae bacterium]